MRKVGATGIDLQSIKTTPQLTQYRRLIVVLLTQGREILGLVPGENHRTQALKLTHDRLFRGTACLRQVAQKCADFLQQIQFFRNHAMRHAHSSPESRFNPGSSPL